MVLKRKRSESEFSTTSSLFSSPPSAGNFGPSPHSSFPIATPALFSSRTRKRHRDNRPSEAEVHRRTLSILFGAQQNTQAQSQSPTSPPSIPAQQVGAVSTLPPSQRSSLHSFWTLPSQPRPSPFSNELSAHARPSPASLAEPFSPPTSCEDCNASLDVPEDEDSMDVDMLAMDTGDRNFGCVSCGKQVCHACAVSNLGLDRRCLNCAQPKKRWEGGLGWVPQR